MRRLYGTRPLGIALPDSIIALFTRKTSRLLTEAVRAGPLAGLTVASRELISDTEDETFDKILALAGESLDGLFDSRHYLKPVVDFRDEVAAALPRRTAAQLIELCQVECSPRVSFETAQTKTKER